MQVHARLLAHAHSTSGKRPKVHHVLSSVTARGSLDFGAALLDECASKVRVFVCVCYVLCASLSALSVGLFFRSSASLCCSWAPVSAVRWWVPTLPTAASGRGGVVLTKSHVLCIGPRPDERAV